MALDTNTETQGYISRRGSKKVKLKDSESAGNNSVDFVKFYEKISSVPK